MITPQPVDEASEIIEIIDKYFPKIFEANRSIEWLHKYTRQGKQPEWQGFFFEEYSFPLLTNFLGGWYGVRIIKGSRIDYQRHYNWDLKVHSLQDKNGKPQTGIILNDKAATDRIIKTESGIGFIIQELALLYVWLILHLTPLADYNNGGINLKIEKNLIQNLM
jgi:hypothetical protein